MFCVKCGTPCREGALFCAECGARLFVPKNAPEMPAPPVYEEPAAAYEPQPVMYEEPAAAPSVEPAVPVYEPEPAAAAYEPQPAEYQEQAAAYAEPVRYAEPAAETYEPQQAVYQEQPAAYEQPVTYEQPAAYAEPVYQEQPAAYEQPAPAVQVPVQEYLIDPATLPPVINRVKTIKRKWNFEQIVETFQVRNGSFENVKTVLQRIDYQFYKFTRVELRIFEEEKGFGFVGGDWAATLTYRGSANGIYTLKFQFVRWKKTMGMNETLTAVEQALLLIDPETTYEERYAKVKTKTNFF